MDPTLRQYLRQLARKGGRARAKTLSKAERQAIAKRAAAARWGQKGTTR